MGDEIVHLSDVRSKRVQAANEWTPRDVLVAMLTAIDEGRARPEELFVAYRDENGVAYQAAYPQFRSMLGTVEAAKIMFVHGSLEL